MAYFNSITNDAVMKERQQAFEQEANRRQLVRTADAQQSQPKMNGLVVIRMKLAKVIQLPWPRVKIGYKA